MRRRLIRPKDPQRFVLATAFFICFAFAALAYAGVPSIALKPYQVFAFNDLGMHCYDSDYSVFTILPPFNTLHAQVVRRGAAPQLQDDTQVNVYYKALRDPSGSINTTSGTIRGVKKTNFWDHVSQLFGLNLQVNQGINVPPPDGPCSWMPGPLNKRQAFAQGYNAGMNWFTAAGIPITQMDDNLKLNAYPLMKVKVTKGTKAIGGLPTVVPISKEMNCSDCHVTGGIAANAMVQQNYGIAAWSSSTDLVVQYKENILILHDARNLTTLLAEKPVLCAVCHYSPALDLAGSGPPPGNVPFMSYAIHGFHGQLLDGVGDPLFPRVRLTNNNACFQCHPGPITQCFRGVMASAGLVCIDCHGNMLAVGAVGQLNKRYPWVDLPLCQSCHTGDVLNNYDGQLIRRTAYTDSPDVATFIIPANKRFAEEPAGPGYPGTYGYKLYRNSLGHKNMDMACESCHGSPHAIWPSREANDNLAAKAIQGHGGKIIECAACHGTRLAATLGGPHGLHNVNSHAWVTGHHSFFESSSTECQACHGQFGHGTVLSTAAADRVFSAEEIGTVRFPKGTQIHCALCHENKLAP